MMRLFRVDLHIHTCLSPCGDWEMSPRNIARRCREAGLELIAVCDHNSCENAAAVMAAAAAEGITVLPGLEICSREEVHLLAVFGGLAAAQAMQRIVNANLSGGNTPEIFGFQLVVNERDEVLRECPRLLIGATGLRIEDVVAQTHALEGISLASHVDRPANGIIGQLGFIPAGLALDGLEVSARIPLARAAEILPETAGRPCLTSSDAHRLVAIGRAFTIMRMAAPSFEELGLALRGERGRAIVAGGPDA
jgi:hypothetical protein